MIHYLTIGVVLGLSAGLAPGPLLTLVISETILHDIRAGIRVALAPLVTDPPIILLTVFILAKLSNFHGILGIISIVGGFVVLGMGIKGLKFKGLKIDVQKARSRSLLKGILVNFLSPHPYLFWLSVGAPTMTRANDRHVFAAAVFVISFYLLLVGSKIVLAVLVGKSKTFLKGRVYIYTMKFLGFALCALAVFLFKDGLELLGIL
ncbi:MAG: LysE family translocator [Deltaproteobacteria bacterium]|nr:MAG: LysE family translocator [Deltaproteobacteria bacterium]